EFVAFGGLAAKNWQIQSGGAGLHPLTDYLREAVRRGIRFTNISPLRSDTEGVIEADWIPIRPGSDTALILALAHVILERDAADRKFLDRYCVGFDRFEN